MKFVNRFLFLITILFFWFFIFSVPASADTLGQNQQFFISPQYDARSRTSVIAALKHISGRAYFYIEDDYWRNVGRDARSQILGQVELLGREFDSRIYPLETQFFGSEPNPGVDNDPRITILLSPLIENAGGYFDTSNNYKKEQAPNSNEREMIYLNVFALGDQKRINAFLAHEFQHLISFNQKEIQCRVGDDVWLNELRSEYAPTLLGYNDDFSSSHLEKRAKAFAESPSDSLTEWKNLPADYGQIGLFGEYLAEHWSPEIIASTLKVCSAGIISMNVSLGQNGFSDSFADVFSRWAAASILNDASVDDKLGYTRESLGNFRIAPTRVLSNLGDSITFAVSDTFKDWQVKWFDISQFAGGQKSFLKIDFSSPSLASFYVPYLVFKTDGSRTLSVFNPTVHSSTLYIDGIGSDVNRIVLMPIKKDKISGFTPNETAIPLSFSAERVESIPQGETTPSSIPTQPSLLISPLSVASSPLPSIPDGSLIRAEGDYKVYVIQGRWRRHIIGPEIFSFYPHLGFDKVKVVLPSVLAQHQESNLVRYQLGQKVYSIDESGTKHWLNISAEQFTASGRAWDSIFIVNLSELNFYKLGIEIKN